MSPFAVACGLYGRAAGGVNATRYRPAPITIALKSPGGGFARPKFVYIGLAHTSAAPFVLLNQRKIGP